MSNSLGTAYGAGNSSPITGVQYTSDDDAENSAPSGVNHPPRRRIPLLGNSDRASHLRNISERISQLEPGSLLVLYNPDRSWRIASVTCVAWTVFSEKTTRSRTQHVPWAHPTQDFAFAASYSGGRGWLRAWGWSALL